MKASKPFQAHLADASSLVTSYEETRAGFIALALERNRRATPFIEVARSLKVAASAVNSPVELLRLESIRPSLLTASGVSDKAASHMRYEDQTAAIQGLIENFLEPAGSDFVEELVFRFLLTRGDTLGGTMRNIGGALAQRKLTRAILANLGLSKTPYQWLHGTNETWMAQTENDADIELNLRGITWRQGANCRTLIYNLKVPLISKSVDLCLFNCSAQDLSELDVKLAPERYLALGELKGGIDPAGADEHWKTASKALGRIRAGFLRKRLKPHIFFVGAAIAKDMANEIWRELKSGTLSNAANLTNHEQAHSLSRWLIEL